MQYGQGGSPSPPESSSASSQQQQQHYPPPVGYSEQQQGPPQPFRSHSTNSSTHSSDNGQGGGQYPYQHSNPSLPRYQSSQQLPQQSSPLNPGAAASRSSNSSSRFSSYNGQDSIGRGAGGQQHNAHPLSNTMYMDSSPTLAGSDVLMSPSEEKKLRLGVNDSLGDYVQPLNTQANTAAPLPTGASPYRRGPLKATGFTALYRAWSGANLGDSGKDERHIKLPRLGYLDGLKFIAAWVVLNGTLFNATIDDGDYSFIQRNSPLYITRSTGLGITFLLLLLGRSLVTPLWDVPAPSPRDSMSATAVKPNSALISWARLTRAMIIRPFRFILPVLAIVGLQWGLSSAGRTKNCNAVGMDEPYWGLISSFAGYCTLVFDLFTTYEQDTLAGQTFAGNLWTNPWFFQSSFAVYVTHMMLGNLSSNRYWVYGLLAFFSWCTYNYFFIAIIGLVFADMHAHGHLHRIRTKWPAYQRLTLHALLITLALVTQWVPVIRDNINKGLAVINVQQHPELTFCDAIFASCWLLAIETSGLAQNILGNIVMRTLGKFSAGLYLLAPAITYTIVPDVALSMSQNGNKASTVLGVSWLVLFIITLALAVVFHFVVELPSKMLGEVVVELLETADGEGGWRRGGAGAGGVQGGKLRKNPGGGQQKLQQAQPVGKPVLV